MLMQPVWAVILQAEQQSLGPCFCSREQTDIRTKQQYEGLRGYQCDKNQLVTWLV